MIQQLGYGVSGNIGVLGIADSQGGYTYYADYTSALQSAKAGDTIVQFANIIETRPVVLTLKNGVNLNLNGFTYTVNNSKSNIAITDNNVAVTCNIMNGKISLLLNQSSVVGYSIYIQNGSSNITTDCNIEGTLFVTGGVVVYNAGTWVGGKINLINPNDNYVIRNIGIMSNVYASGSDFGNDGGILNNCIMNSTGSRCFVTSVSTVSTWNNCISVGGAYGGIYNINYAATIIPMRVNNCVFISAGIAQYATSVTGTFTNCVFISTANIAFSGPENKCYNCLMYSTANIAVGVNSTRHGGNSYYNCTLISTVAATVSINNNYYWHGPDTFINSTIDCQWNNVGGHCIISTGIPGINTYNVIGCHLKVINRNAKCLNSVYIMPSTYINNTFIGSNYPISDNLVQIQQKVPDLYDNISIG